MVSFKSLLEELEEYRLQYYQQVNALIYVVLLCFLVPRDNATYRTDAPGPNHFFNKYLILNLQEVNHDVNGLEDGRGHIQLLDRLFRLITTLLFHRSNRPQKVLTHRKEESLRQPAVSLDV